MLRKFRRQNVFQQYRCIFAVDQISKVTPKPDGRGSAQTQLKKPVRRPRACCDRSAHQPTLSSPAEHRAYWSARNKESAMRGEGDPGRKQKRVMLANKAPWHVAEIRTIAPPGSPPPHALRCAQNVRPGMTVIGLRQLDRNRPYSRISLSLRALIFFSSAAAPPDWTVAPKSERCRASWLIEFS